MSASSPFRSDAHAVIIGINEYLDAKIPNLKFARADAEGIHKILIDPELGRIPPEYVILVRRAACNTRHLLNTEQLSPQSITEKSFLKTDIDLRAFSVRSAAPC